LNSLCCLCAVFECYDGLLLSYFTLRYTKHNQIKLLLLSPFKESFCFLKLRTQMCTNLICSSNWHYKKNKNHNVDVFVITQWINVLVHAIKAFILFIYLSLLLLLKHWVLFTVCIYRCYLCNAVYSINSHTQNKHTYEMFKNVSLG